MEAIIMEADYSPNTKGIQAVLAHLGEGVLVVASGYAGGGYKYGDRCCLNETTLLKLAKDTRALRTKVNLAEPYEVMKIHSNDGQYRLLGSIYGVTDYTKNPYDGRTNRFKFVSAKTENEVY